MKTLSDRHNSLHSLVVCLSGLKRLAGFMREHYSQYGASGWILKADVLKFFASIDHLVVKERLRRIIPDPYVMRLLEKIIDSFNAETGKGIPMGNQTSQLFALYYLDPLDRLIKERLRVKHYTRYMDDMVLLHADRDFLRHCLALMLELASSELKLELNEKTQIFPLRHGVDYPAWHFYLTETGKVVKKLRASSKNRIKRHIRGLQKGYAEGKLGFDDVNRSIASTHGHLKHGQTYGLRLKVYEETVFTRKEGLIC